MLRASEPDEARVVVVIDRAAEQRARLGAAREHLGVVAPRRLALHAGLKLEDGVAGPRARRGQAGADLGGEPALDARRVGVGARLDALDDVPAVREPLDGKVRRVSRSTRCRLSPMRS